MYAREQFTVARCFIAQQRTQAVGVQAKHE
jgi:hypothetical protein